MTACSDYREELSAYIDGELSWDEREAIEKHIAACPACADELAALEHTQELCQHIEDVETPADLTSSIMTNVHERRQQKARERKKRYYSLGAVAAVFMVFMVGLHLMPLPVGWGQLAQGLPGVIAPSDHADFAEAPRTPAPQDTEPALDDFSLATEDIDRDGLMEATDRMVVKTGELHAEVKEGRLGEVETHIVQLVEEVDGYIEDSSQGTEASGQRWATLLVRVPAEEFNRVLYAFDDELARVLKRSAATEDVSEEYSDLNAHLRNREAQEQRLLEIMEKADTVEEIMQVENELARVRSEIERLIGRMRRLESVVTLSAIRIQLRETGSAIGEISTWWDDVQAAFVGSLRNLGVYLAFFLPYLAFVVLVWVGIRWMRSRTRKKE